MLTALLFANLLQGVVALVWILGLRKLAGPLPPGLVAGQLSLAVALGPLAALWRLVGGPTPPVRLVRVEVWAERLAEAGWWLWVPVGTLLVGTVLLFLVQEALPALQARHLVGALHRDRRLEGVLNRVLAAYEAEGLDVLRGRRPHILRVESGRSVAQLRGLSHPRILVTDGLLARLDEGQLEAAVAHEVAHLMRGGNLRTLGLWGLRALQAANPAVLVLFRAYLEMEELACDAVAARATGRPAVLAATLLELVGRGGATTAGLFEKAHRRVVRRADVASTRLRVRALLDTTVFAPPAGALLAASALFLGTVYWSIG